MSDHWPAELDAASLKPTREALHGYAQVLGDWLKSCRPARKHWWHASLRPALGGLTTGVVHADVDFEIELNLRDSQLCVRTSTGEMRTEALQGQPRASVADTITQFLCSAGVDRRTVPAPRTDGESAFDGYQAEQAQRLAGALAAVSATMGQFRATIREETSPIQLWPHHFDLSMLWLPGERVPDEDPDDAEQADKQMNFGFTFGDEQIHDPYFYVTAYPQPVGLERLSLPAGARWESGGFSGAVLRYADLMTCDDPQAGLINLWGCLLSAGRDRMLSNPDKGDDL